MLNITPQRSAAAAKSYFSKSDGYYTEGRQELIGNWGGKGAALLGLSGEVSQQMFGQLCDNRNPNTGEALTPITRSSRRSGFDFTWSAAKSISVVHALTGDERIVTAFRDSIRETMSELETEMAARVRKGGADFDRTTGNMIWSEFVHLTSRPVNSLPSAQLHIHVYVQNCSYDAVESTWKAGQFGKIKTDAYYWQAVQQARFARKLQGLGYAIRATKNAFEIDGVPETVLKKFSLRTAQIEQVAKKLGITDPKAKAKLGATTREAKLDDIPYQTLVNRWDAMLSPDERAALHASRGAAITTTDRSDQHAQFAASHLFERTSVTDERRLMALALRRGIGSVSPEGVRAAVAKLDLLRREKEGRVLVTTPAALKDERALLGFAAEGKASCRPIAAALPAGWKAELAASKLSDEQRKAVEHVLCSSDRVMIVAGAPGSGKTTLTTEAVHRIEQAGRSVTMLAPSANASRGVLRAEGFSEADTLARFLIDEKMQAKAQRGVIWLDEAGLAGVKTLGRLFDVARAIDARIVLSGDTRQTTPVEAGSPLRLLETIAGLKVAHVSGIRRQRGSYLEVVKLLSAGKAAEGFAKLDALGWVKTLSADDGYLPVARDFVDKLQASRGKPDGVAIVCPTHSEGQKIVTAVREEMRRRGLIHGEERTFTRWVPTQWTEAQRGDRDGYSGEEYIQLHRNSGEFKAGQRVRAADMLRAKRPPSPAHFAVYRESSIAFAAGDIIRITANGKAKTGQRLNNGAIYSVAGFTRSGDIALTNGTVIDKHFSHASHGIVSTAQAAQGRTVDHVLVCLSAESYPASSKEGFLVAVSRGKRTAVVYTDDKQDLKAAVDRSQPRLSAIELMSKPRVPWWRRTRDRIARMGLNLQIAEKSRLWLERPTKEYAHAR